MSDERKRLIAELRKLARGYHEFRVQDPVTGAYCMAYSGWRAEIECAEWLADHRARFPGGQHAGYEVKRVHVLTETDRLMLAAADALEAAEAERAEAYRAGAEAMRELCWREAAQMCGAFSLEIADALKLIPAPALPLPTMPAPAGETETRR